DALKQAGCERIFVEKASGAQRDRLELKAALDFIRANSDDVLVVWKLDRLARSLRQLIETVEDLEKRGIGFESLTERIDTASAAGRLTFHILPAGRNSRDRSIASGPAPLWTLAEHAGEKVEGRRQCRRTILLTRKRSWLIPTLPSRPSLKG